MKTKASEPKMQDFTLTAPKQIESMVNEKYKKSWPALKEEISEAIKQQAKDKYRYYGVILGF